MLEFLSIITTSLCLILDYVIVLQVLLMLARRGSILPALANVVAHPRDFYLAASSPFGSTFQKTQSSSGSFTWDEMIGGVQQHSK